MKILFEILKIMKFVLTLFCSVSSLLTMNHYPLKVNFLTDWLIKLSIYLKKLQFFGLGLFLIELFIICCLGCLRYLGARAFSLWAQICLSGCCLKMFEINRFLWSCLTVKFVASQLFSHLLKAALSGFGWCPGQARWWNFHSLQPRW